MDCHIDQHNRPMCYYGSHCFFYGKRQLRHLLRFVWDRCFENQQIAWRKKLSGQVTGRGNSFGWLNEKCSDIKLKKLRSSENPCGFPLLMKWWGISLGFTDCWCTYRTCKPALLSHLWFYRHMHGVGVWKISRALFRLWFQRNKLNGNELNS